MSITPFVDNNVDDVDMAEVPTTTTPAKEPAEVTAPPRQRRSHPHPVGVLEAEAREQERGRRWREDAWSVRQFDLDTTVSRNWYKDYQGKKKTWDNERARIAERMPELKRELAKMELDLKTMAAAEQAYEKERGEKVEEGRKNAELLEKYHKYMTMEHDEKPDLD